MSEIDSTTKNELNTRKETLNRHLAKFNELKSECKWSEAWSQLLVTLNYANDTLKYSANLLKNISQKMPQLSPEQQAKINNLTSNNTLSLKNVSGSVDNADNKKPAIKKMIVIPKKQNIH